MPIRETYLPEKHIYQRSMSIRETYRWHTSLSSVLMCISQAAISYARIPQTYIQIGDSEADLLTTYIGGSDMTDGGTNGVP